MRLRGRTLRVIGLASSSLLVAGLIVLAGPAAVPAAPCATWGAQPPHVGPSDDLIYGVDGTSSCDVWMVGNDNDGVADRTLIYRMTPAGWKVQASANALGNSYLNGVSAVSPALAWAVGSSVNGPLPGRTLVERWNGKVWKVQSSPNVGSSFNTLQGVDGTSATNAWAVGNYLAGVSRQAMILHWNGRAWKVQKTFVANGSAEALLFQVSATSAKNAWAVGEANDRTVILHWNGKSWKRQASPNVGSEESGLDAVSAVSATNAWAVGTFREATHLRTLVLHWNGKRWRVQASPSPGSGLFDDALTGVSATPAGAWAVGNALDANGSTTLILRWTGSKWVRQASPDLDTTAPLSNVLSGVVAISASNVWAVGTFSGSPIEPAAFHCC
ncbi:MAG TPA: hypothetical protein VLX89_04090 [Actinomycetota bacterium]|nr:hypothetical protein [Actinomycetota bacterium]